MRSITIVAFLSLLVLLISSASAERESAKVGQFIISFEMKNTHEIKEAEEGIDIKTFDGTVNVQVIKDKSGASSLDALLRLLDANYANKEELQIDGKDARLITAIGGGYIALYYPQSGYTAMITSGMPMMETSDFLKTLHIEASS